MAACNFQKVLLIGTVFKVDFAVKSIQVKFIGMACAFGRFWPGVAVPAISCALYGIAKGRDGFPGGDAARYFLLRRYISILPSGLKY